MPKKTFYLSEDDLTTYEKAKSIAGDSISSVIMQGLKEYVVKWEKQDKGFADIVVFEGKTYAMDNLSKGQNVQFVGKLLSKVVVGDDQPIINVFKLYLTRKGKLFLNIIVEDRSEMMVSSSYEVKDSILDFKERSLPAELLAEAEKNMPGITCKVLDI